MAFRPEEQREYFRYALRARYLAPIVGKERDMIAATPVVAFRQAADAVSLSD